MVHRHNVNDKCELIKVYVGSECHVMYGTYTCFFYLHICRQNCIEQVIYSLALRERERERVFVRFGNWYGQRNEIFLF
jgi:hypothetical protein